MFKRFIRHKFTLLDLRRDSFVAIWVQGDNECGFSDYIAGTNKTRHRIDKSCGAFFYSTFFCLYRLVPFPDKLSDWQAYIAKYP